MVSRTCSKCLIDTPLHLLVKRADCRGGYSRVCLKCKAAVQREARKVNGDIYTKKYEKTEKGYLMRSYRNMLSRVMGVQKTKSHLYKGLDILSKEDFINWSLETNFKDLLLGYEESGYDRKLAPSVDRIDSILGYTIGNIRWITHSENSRLGALSQNKRKIH